MNYTAFGNICFDVIEVYISRTITMARQTGDNTITANQRHSDYPRVYIAFDLTLINFIWVVFVCVCAIPSMINNCYTSMQTN